MPHSELCIVVVFVCLFDQTSIVILSTIADPERLSIFVVAAAAGGLCLLVLILSFCSSSSSSSTGVLLFLSLLLFLSFQ